MRKKNNPLKRAQRFFTRTRIWHWESSGDEAHCVVRKAAGLWCAVEHDIAEGILRYRNHWRVCARVLLLATAIAVGGTLGALAAAVHLLERRVEVIEALMELPRR